MKPFAMRVLSLLMTVILLLSIALPTVSLAVEEKTVSNLEQSTNEFYSNEYAVTESTGASSHDTEPAEDGTEPAEDGTEPAEDGTEPAEDGTEPAEDGTEPAEDGTEPAEDGTEPAEDGTEPAEDGTEPAEDGTEPTEDGTEPAEDGTEPTEDGTEPTEDGTEPTEDGTEPTEKITEAFNSVQAPEGYVTRNEILEKTPISFMALDRGELPKVLLIEDVLPWDSTANQEILSGITEFDKTTTADFLNVELEDYGVVVFANDQPFNTYQNYEAFKEYLEVFANLGGVIVFGACDAGWSDGTLSEMLPGNVSKRTHYVNTNYVVDSTHMIVKGSLTDDVVLTDKDLISNYCSHVSFDEETIPAGSKIILRESDTNRPTLIEYPLGKGRVIASGLTWEHNYVYGGTDGRGSFAAVAMEDMFRYAIRVSSIDVDELHLLEEWRTEKNSHIIVVADSDGGIDNLSPIAGATVSINSVQYTTDENGIVMTTDYGVKTVTVSAEGYRDYKEMYELEEQKSRMLLLEKETNDGLPYITLCTAAKNGKTPYVDLRNQALYFIEGKGTMLIMWLEGNWNGHGEGAFHVIQEAAAGIPGKTIRVPVGNYLNFAPGKTFAPNAQIKVQMVAADGTKSEMIDLNIEVDKAPVEGGPTTNTAIKEGVSTFDWLGNFPIKSDDELFTKVLTTDMSISSELIPVEIVAEHNEDGTFTHKILIGIVTGEGSKNILYNKTNEKDFEIDTAWKEFKKQIKGYKKAGNPKQYWNNLEKKYNKQIHGTRLRASFDTDLKVCGFAEVTWNQNKEIIKSDGGLIVNGGGHWVIGKTFYPGPPVPLYFEFRPGVDAELSGGINFYNENDSWTIKPVFSGLDVALPSISLEGGVGVRGVATAGVTGTGKMITKLPGLDDPQINIDLAFEAGFHVKVLFLAEWEESFASAIYHFYPKEKAVSLLTLAMEDVNEEEMVLASRDYQTSASAWNGSPAALMALDGSEQPVHILQEGVMPDVMPQIHKIGDKQIMLFIRDVAERTIGNHTQLVYSVCDGGVWSEPLPVWESDTADFFFNTAVNNGQMVVAWQKSSAVVTGATAEALLETVAQRSEICVAEWDEESGSFTNQKYITDNDILDMMPAVATDGENITVNWVSNDANNVFGTEGNYQICQVAITDDGALPIQRLYTTEDFVVELAAGMNQSGNHLIFSAMNEAGTVDLYSINDNKTNKIVSSENITGLSYSDGMFLWQEDGSIYKLIAGSTSIGTLVSSEVASVSSSYEYITNGTSDAVVWSETTDEGYEVKASVCTAGSWSVPVLLLSGEQDTVSFMDAVLLDNGNYSIILNTVDYTNEDDIELTTLQYANVVPKTDVSLELAELEHPNWEECTQEINIALENNGTVPVYSADLTVSCETGTLLEETLILELLPGQSQIVTKTLPIQSVNKEMEGMVSIRIENDVDAGDNTMAVALGQVDTSLGLDVYKDGDQFLFVLTATNRSITPANAALSVIEDNLNGVVLNMKNIGIINNTENVQYLFSIDRSKIDFAGKETKTYFFSLSNLESDWDECDNMCTYVIKAPRNAPSDPDGEMTIIDIVQPESVTIGEEFLHFSSLADESVQLNALVYPENASVTAVYWSAENNDIVHITEDGLVTPLREGTTVITAMVTDNIKDTITVTVATQPVAPHVHSFGNPTFLWNENYSCTAEVLCDCGHSEFVECEVISETNAATCTNAGTTVYTAVYNSYSEDLVVTIPALGHNVILVETEDPSCEQNGFEYYSCERCGGHESTIILEATGHDYVEDICINCGEKDPDGKEPSVPSTPIKPSKPNWSNIFDKWFGNWWGDKEEQKCEHSYTDVVTKPTCTEKGYTTHTCSKCKDSYKDTYTNALGHVWDEGKVNKEATCTKDGMKSYTCETCGKNRTETIKATGHDYEDGICGSCGAEEPTKPSEPSKPNKPGWIFDWIFGGWWK